MDPERLESLLERHEVSVMQATPTTWQLLGSWGWRVGPAVGGPIAEQYDWRAALLFCIVAGLVAIGLALPLARRRSTVSSKPTQPRDRLGWAAAFAVTLVLLPHLATFLFRMSVSQLALPLYATGPGGLDPSAAGLMLGTQGVMALVMLGPAGWATNRFGVRPVVAGALLVTSLAVAAVPLVPTPLRALGSLRSRSAAGWR